MKIKSSGDAVDAIEAIRVWALTKLPAKQPQPWNGHSPEQCMLINALTGLTTATYNLNRYEEILKSMAGGKTAEKKSVLSSTPEAAKMNMADENPLL
jgi:hypothetical protein